MNEIKQKYRIIIGTITIAFLIVTNSNALSNEQTEQAATNLEKNEYYSAYELDASSMTVGEFKNFVYSELCEDTSSDLVSFALEVDKIFKKLDQIGVTSDMTIAEAGPIIEQNLNIFTADFCVNRNCRIKMWATFPRSSGYSIPSRRPFANIRPIPIIYWKINCGDTGYVKINGESGKQIAEYDQNTYKGFSFILKGEISNSWPLLGSFEIDGNSKITISNVPFVSSLNSQQISKKSQSNSVKAFFFIFSSFYYKLTYIFSHRWGITTDFKTWIPK